MKSLSWSESVRKIVGKVFVIVKFPVEVIAPVTSRPAVASKFPSICTPPPLKSRILLALFVSSFIVKVPLPLNIEKSESLFVSVKYMRGKNLI